MNNTFTDFVETYWEDISAFFKALRNWIEAIIGKLNAEDEETTEAAE
ncbi:MAG: hypothetical protein IJ491_06235 [Clostridia bacterium]|nr:hypothetical protein [Clostridia bacterium]